MFIWTFFLRITYTIISQSIADSSWIILYIYIYIYIHTHTYICNFFYYRIIIHHMHLGASCHRTKFQTTFLASNILCLSKLYYSTMSFNQNYMIFSHAVISTHYNCICVLVLTTLKMATSVAETHQWSLCNKIIHKNPSAFVDPFNKFYASNQCMEHGT